MVKDIASKTAAIINSSLEHEQWPTLQVHATEVLANKILCALFPPLATKLDCGPKTRMAENLEKNLISVGTELLERLNEVGAAKPEEIVATVFNKLPHVRRTLLSDIDALVQGDPAASGAGEVLLSYPGFIGIGLFRIAHELWQLGVPLIPRVITEYAHRITGIDIHPGATIGERFCVDHGTGLVIGGTAKIGRNVKIYQGVTLGALSVKKSMAGRKRHPTIEDDVVIYAHATILGGDTIIGQGSVIGGNMWITESVPAGSRVLQPNRERGL